MLLMSEELRSLYDTVQKLAYDLSLEVFETNALEDVVCAFLRALPDRTWAE